MQSAAHKALADIAETIRSCQLCPLWETRCNAVPGEGPPEAKIVFVGEAPGKVNDEVGRPFVGHGGRVFDGILEACGIARAEVYVTNAVRCLPLPGKPPSAVSLRTCNRYLNQELQTLEPDCVVTLGGVAFHAVTGDRISMKAEHGQTRLLGKTVVCPTFHPNGIRDIRGGRSAIVHDIESALAEIGRARPEDRLF